MIRHIARSRPESDAAVTGSEANTVAVHRNVCKSPMRLAGARARRSVLLRDSSFISTDAKGSSGSCERALNTTFF